MPAEAPSGRAGRRPRVSKRVLRRWAYVGGVVSFAVPWTALAAVPKPPASADPVPTQVIEVRKITRRVIVHDPPHAPASSGGPSVRYVYVGGGGAGGGGGGVVHTRCSTC